MKETLMEVAHLIISKGGNSIDMGYFRNLNQLTKLLNIIRINNNMKLIEVKITWLTTTNLDEKLTNL